MSVLQTLENICQKGFVACGLDQFPVLAMPTQYGKFGDYQINGIMGAAKKLGVNPHDLALSVAEVLKSFDEFSSVEVIKGFINIRLSDQFIQKNLETAHLVSDKQNGLWVVDYSSPNIAKQMHIGHLRSSVLGDSLCRIFEKKGISVIRQNHIGDAGSQFGLLCAYAKQENINPSSMEEVESLYVQANMQKHGNKQLIDAAASATLGLQNDDSDVVEFWGKMRSLSLQSLHETYGRLGLSLTENDVCGESSYYEVLPSIIEELKSLGMAYEDQGALVVKVSVSDTPVIIQKSDGAYLYASTDLAALKKRLLDMGADKVVYVTDNRQQYHFQQIFDIASQIGWIQDLNQLEHIGFGVMTDESNKPFQTRKGGSLKLNQLLDEATQTAFWVLSKRFPDQDHLVLKANAEKLGIAAIKYAELNRKRDKDYQFDLDNMLSFNGNTAPYLLYALARAVKVMEKAGNPDVSDICITKENRSLVLKLNQYNDELNRAFEERMPHILAQYLYDLANEFNRFYEAVNVLKQENPNPTLYVYQKFIGIMSEGLGILGIPIIKEL